MSDIRHINTQDIRKDLVGFLKSLESGEEVAVLNRSRVVARLNRPHRSRKDIGQVRDLLAAASEIHRSTVKKPGGLGPTESYKTRYYKDMAKKYDVS